MTQPEKMVWAAAFALVIQDYARGRTRGYMDQSLMGMGQRASEVACAAVLAMREAQHDRNDAYMIEDVAPVFLREMGQIEHRLRERKDDDHE